VRIDLALQRFDLRGEQELFLLLEAVFDARVVPNLDRCRHRENRRKVDEQREPGLGARQVEQPQRIAGAHHLADELEADRRDEQHDLPVDLHLPQHAPHVARNAEDDERRKVPDIFLGTGLAKAAAGESAANREEGRAVLADGERRQRHRQSDDAAGVGTCDQSGQQRAFERQIRRVIVEEHTRGHPCGERHGKA